MGRSTRDIDRLKLKKPELHNGAVVRSIAVHDADTGAVIVAAARQAFLIAFNGRRNGRGLAWRMSANAVRRG